MRNQSTKHTNIRQSTGVYNKAESDAKKLKKKQNKEAISATSQQIHQTQETTPKDVEPTPVVQKSSPTVQLMPAHKNALQKPATPSSTTARKQKNVTIAIPKVDIQEQQIQHSEVPVPYQENPTRQSQQIPQQYAKTIPEAEQLAVSQSQEVVQNHPQFVQVGADYRRLPRLTNIAQDLRKMLFTIPTLVKNTLTLPEFDQK